MMEGINKRARRVADTVILHRDTIMDALRQHAFELTDHADQAQKQYEAGQANPEVLTAQNSSHVTNEGWRQLAETKHARAEANYRAAEALRVALDNDDAP